MNTKIEITKRFFKRPYYSHLLINEIYINLIEFFYHLFFEQHIETGLILLHVELVIFLI
jgi:hypothetical protein